jgi:thiol:disulfide interchange protein DsbA
MNRISRHLALAAAALALIAQAAVAQVAGKEFAPLEPPQPTVSQAQGKIEVLEFFSFGCIHCYRLHDIAKQWAAKQPADVVFVRVPVTFDRAQMVPMAKLFYALEATGDLDRLDTAVFRAYHDQGNTLATDQAVLDWVARQGIDAKKFADVYHSFGVQSKVKRAEQLTNAYKVRGTPAVYVAGRYMVKNDGVTSYEQIMEVAGFLVDRVRAEQPKTRGIRG